jgi:hypothetical protein
MRATWTMCASTSMAFVTVRRRVHEDHEQATVFDDLLQLGQQPVPGVVRVGVLAPPRGR